MSEFLIMHPVKDMDFSHIDEFDSISRQGKLKQVSGTEQTAWTPERLENGKWACNHKCKNKKA